MRPARTATDLVLALVEVLSCAEWPELAMHRIQSAYIDAIACIVAGATTQSGRIATEALGETLGGGDATVLGTTLKAQLADAALVNGIAARALDYDDTCGAFGPMSAMLVPAILGTAEVHGATGKQLIAAYGVGFDVTSRILKHANRATEGEGRQSTSTAVVGAAAAVGTLIQAKPAVLGNALALAASTSSGWHRSSSTTNPLNAGLAARNAILAVELAQRGFGLDAGAVQIDDPLTDAYRGDGRRGFAEVMGTDRRLSILETGLTAKRFASCAASHAAVDAILELRKLHPRIANSENVASIDVRVDRAAAEILFEHNPATGDQGRLSIEHAVAAALIDGWVGIPQLSDERVNRADVHALRSRVQMIVDLDASLDVANWPAYVVVRLKDGTVIKTSVQHPKGRPDKPLDDADLVRKFVECCEPVLGARSTSRALAALTQLSSLGDISQLIAYLTV